MGLARSERSLVAAARRGNRDAIDELLRRYQPALYRVAFGITGSPAGALDVVQDVFLKVYQRFQYDGRSKFHTWLYRVTANEALNWRKRERLDQPPLEIEAAAEMPWAA